MNEEIIKKCTLFLLSITDKEVVIPHTDVSLFLNIHEEKEECISELLKLLERERKLLQSKRGTEFE